MNSKNNSLKRKVCVFTGTRAEYGLLRPIIKEINNSNCLELILVVTGMHLSKRYGLSISEIEKDGFRINHKIKLDLSDDSPYLMSRNIGIGIEKMSNFFRDNKVDVLLVLGDRSETLSSVIAAVYMNIPVAHIHGGDVSKAGLDESARHAITKFANIHFPATKKSAERIIRLGEEKWRIHISGAPCLDTILNTKLFGKNELQEELKIKLDDKYILLLQHPVTTQVNKSKYQIEETLHAIKKLGLQTIIIYPNSDSGGLKIIEAIDTYKNSYNYKNENKIITFKNLPHKTYLSLMKHSSVMVGNSSSGIIESSSFKLPVVNIGIRQEGRERAENVIDCDHDSKEILNAINKCLSKEFIDEISDVKNPYGKGESSKVIIEVLSDFKKDLKLMQKVITY